MFYDNIRIAHSRTAAIFTRKNVQLENVAINRDALQLEDARRRDSHFIFRFNWDARAKFEVGQRQPISNSVLTAHNLRYAVTLTFDLWPWTFVVCRLWQDEVFRYALG